MTDLPEPTRRGFLGHVAGAYLCTSALAMGGAAAEPLKRLMDAYATECSALEGGFGDTPEGPALPAWDAINSEDGLPPAQSREVALEALRLAIEMAPDFGNMPGPANLTASALAYFKTA